MNDKKTPFFLDKWWIAGYLFTIGLQIHTMPEMPAFARIISVVADLFLWPVYVGAMLSRLIA